MKWLKKFEEVKLKLKKIDDEGKPYTALDKGLSTDTYRRTAANLRYYNKTKRADVLTDWADEKDYGIYNMYMLINGSGNRASFTEPKLIGIYYGDDIKSSKNLLDYAVDSSEEAEIAVDRWFNANSLNDSPLSISFEFSFRPTKKTGSLPYFRGSYSGNYRGKQRNFYNRIPTFAITLRLSDWSTGVEAFDSTFYDYEDDKDESSSIYHFYKETQDIGLFLRTPFLNEDTFGIFTDRKSANQFLKYFKSIIEDTRIDVKDKIMNILNIVGGEAEDIEKVMYVLNDIRVNSMFDDNPSQSTIKDTINTFRVGRKINKL